MQLSTTTRPVARPAARPVAMPLRRVVLARSTGPHPTQQDVDNLNAKVKEAIKEAEDTCNGGDAAHCAAAWDNVEELSAAASHKKADFKNDAVSSDPLEQFCDDNPDADECRVYDD